MDVVEIGPMPKDLREFLQGVTTFRAPILVGREVTGNHERTGIAIRPSGCADLTKILAAAEVNRRIDHIGLVEVRVSAGRVVEVWRPARGVATVAVADSIDQIAAEPHHGPVFAMEVEGDGRDR